MLRYFSEWYSVYSEPVTNMWYSFSYNCNILGLRTCQAKLKDLTGKEKMHSFTIQFDTYIDNKRKKSKGTSFPCSLNHRIVPKQRDCGSLWCNMSDGSCCSQQLYSLQLCPK